MSERLQRPTTTSVVPKGTTTQQFAPTKLAERLVNLELTPEGTLRTVRGPCPYEPERGPLKNQYGQTVFGAWTGGAGQNLYLLSRLGKKVHGVFHAGLRAGKAPLLLARAGDRMYQHVGWYRGWRRLKITAPDGTMSAVKLTNDLRPGLPDQFLVMGEKVIWTNGIDRPLVIDADGRVTPLGYSLSPGPPLAEGPDTASDPDSAYANSENYSWPGRIGTVGDFVASNEAALLDGEWQYYLQWEDINGNLSPLSPPSSSIRLHYQTTRAQLSKQGKSNDSAAEFLVSTRVSALPRQFVVRSTGEAPPHTVATRLLRTPDMRRNVATPHLVERIAGSRTFVYADNIPDSRLSTPATQVLPVPIIHTMVSHAGRLVLSNGATVYFSEPGRPGTLVRAVTPDPDGAVVTALASHSGRLIAFTERAMVDLTNEAAPPVVMARGVGCDSPGSIQGMPSGALIWHSRDGFYAWAPGGSPPVKLSDPIHRKMRDELSFGAMRRAVSAVDPQTREYRCAVTPAGDRNNTLILCYDGNGWRELSLGFTVNSLCQTDDARQLLLFSGKNQTTGTHDVYVFDHEMQEFPAPTRECVLRSPWLRADEVALQPLNIHTLFVGLIDEIDTELEVSVYANGSLAPDDDSPRKLKAVGTHAASDPAGADLTGSAVIGTAKWRNRRLYWRQVPIGLENVSTWKFQISTESAFHIAAFAVQTSKATMGDSLGRVPFGSD